jgi:hypothetical protein
MNISKSCEFHCQLKIKFADESICHSYLSLQCLQVAKPKAEKPKPGKNAATQATGTIM